MFDLSSTPLFGLLILIVQLTVLLLDKLVPLFKIVDVLGLLVELLIVQRYVNFKVLVFTSYVANPQQQVFNFNVFLREFLFEYFKFVDS